MITTVILGEYPFEYSSDATMRDVKSVLNEKIPSVRKRLDDRESRIRSLCSSMLHAEPSQRPTADQCLIILREFIQSAVDSLTERGCCVPQVLERTISLDTPAVEATDQVETEPRTNRTSSITKRALTIQSIHKLVKLQKLSERRHILFRGENVRCIVCSGPLKPNVHGLACQRSSALQQKEPLVCRACPRSSCASLFNSSLSKANKNNDQRQVWITDWAVALIDRLDTMS